MREVINRYIEILAREPIFWDIFEKIFGDNGAKERLYKSKIPNTCRILDFGCATGNTTKPFINYDYLGVDKDCKAIQGAKKKWKKNKKVQFKCLDILETQNKIGSFDAILFAGTGHHIPDKELVKILKKLSRYLRKRGALHYIDTIKPDRDKGAIVNWLCNIDRGREMRTQKETLELMRKIGHFYIIDQTSVERVTQSLLPQPDYIYLKLIPKR